MLEHRSEKPVQLPHIDIGAETASLDFWVRQMRIEAYYAAKRVETITHIDDLLTQLEHGRISRLLALSWLRRIERSTKLRERA